MDAAKEYRSFYEATKALAMEFLDIDEQCYELSNAEMSRHPSSAARLKKIEEDVRSRVDKTEETKMSRD